MIKTCEDCVAIIKDIFSLIDENILIRNTDNDHDTMAFLKQSIRITQTLKKAQELTDSKKARLDAIDDDVSIGEVLDVIAEVYSEDHTLIIDVAGPCGIEDFSGKVEIDFHNLEELYQWIGRNKSAS